MNENAINELNDVNTTLESILTEPKLREVLCSLYDNEFTLTEVSALLDIDLHRTEMYLMLLRKAGLVNNKRREDVEYYSLTNNKICDALLMLKDELYKTTYNLQRSLNDNRQPNGEKI